MLSLPSVEVTKGDPHPFRSTNQLVTMAGGVVAVIRNVWSLVPLDRKATCVPWLVRYVAAAWMMKLVETSDDAIGKLMPPRLSRLSKYALPSLPSATTSLEGVAPGTSTSNGPELPRSALAMSS